jgi:hypothetical protein
MDRPDRNKNLQLKTGHQKCITGRLEGTWGWNANDINNLLAMLAARFDLSDERLAFMKILTADILQTAAREAMVAYTTKEKPNTAIKADLDLVCISGHGQSIILAYVEKNIRSRGQDYCSTYGSKNEDQELDFVGLLGELSPLWSGVHLNHAKCWQPSGHSWDEGHQKDEQDLVDMTLKKKHLSNKFWSDFHTLFMLPIYELGLYNLPVTTRVDCKLPANGAGCNATHLEAAARFFGRLAAEYLTSYRSAANWRMNPADPAASQTAHDACSWLISRRIPVDRASYPSKYPPHQKKNQKQGAQILHSHAKDLIQLHRTKPLEVEVIDPIVTLQKHLVAYHHLVQASRTTRSSKELSREQQELTGIYLTLTEALDKNLRKPGTLPGDFHILRRPNHIGLMLLPRENLEIGGNDCRNEMGFEKIIQGPKATIGAARGKGGIKAAAELSTQRILGRQIWHLEPSLREQAEMHVRLADRLGAELAAEITGEYERIGLSPGGELEAGGVAHATLREAGPPELAETDDSDEYEKRVHMQVLELQRVQKRRVRAFSSVADVDTALSSGRGISFWKAPNGKMYAEIKNDTGEGRSLLLIQKFTDPNFSEASGTWWWTVGRHVSSSARVYSTTLVEEECTQVVGVRHPYNDKWWFFSIIGREELGWRNNKQEWFRITSGPGTEEVAIVEQ